MDWYHHTHQCLLLAPVHSEAPLSRFSGLCLKYRFRLRIQFEHSHPVCSTYYTYHWHVHSHSAPQFSILPHVFSDHLLQSANPLSGCLHLLLVSIAPPCVHADRWIYCSYLLHVRSYLPLCCLAPLHVRYQHLQCYLYPLHVNCYLLLYCHYPQHGFCNH